MVVHPDSNRVPRVRSYSGYSLESYQFLIRDFHPLRLDFPDHSDTNMIFKLLIESPTTPHPKMWFGLFQFRSPLLSESRLISSPWGTKMVQFPQYRFNILYIQISMTKYYPSRVPPFGNLRINACLQLPAAFRSLPRPSSPHGA
jgi:hypothetical protein